jgi:hypothetical protein
MSSKAAALSKPDANPEGPARPRRVSPDISEVLHLIGAMERLAADVEQRHKAVGITGSD